MSAHTVTPEVGQVWADNDGRSTGRTLVITRTLALGDIDYVHAEVSTDSDYVEASQAHTYPLPSQIGKQTRIRAARLRPTSTGYRLLGTLGFGLDDVIATTPGGVQSDPFQDREDAARWLLGQEAAQ